MKMIETLTDWYSDHAEINKLGAGAYFGVGVRTLENWLHWGSLSGGWRPVKSF